MNKKQIKLFSQLWFGAFFVLFVLSFSFNFQFFIDIGGYTSPLFEKLSCVFESTISGGVCESFGSAEDSFGFYLNVVNVGLLSLILASVVKYFATVKWQLYLIEWIFVLSRYYLILMLLIYGFDKVYKMQFYAPEPNIDFTRVKDLHSDILFWTTMGKSYSYSLITGLIEVIAGLLMLFYKTRLLGILIAIMALFQVYLINIGFDITVKIFSFFLLSIGVFQVIPYLGMLNKIFFSTKSTAIVIPSFMSKLKWGGYKIWIKCGVILLILVESNYKAFSTWNFNDDNYARPYANGAYQVDSYKVNGFENFDQRWDKFYIHRHNYFIIELESEEKFDYRLSIDTTKDLMYLQDYDKHEEVYSFIKNKDSVVIKLSTPGGTIDIKAHQLHY